MKINIQPICNALELKDYDERMSPGQVLVWVNPTRAFLAVRDDLMRGLNAAGRLKVEGLKVEDEQEKYFTFNRQMFEWYAELWSRGDDPELHWTADELSEISKLDPSLFNWLVRESARIMREHRTGEKKN